MAAFTTSEWRLARLYATLQPTMSLWQILLMARMWIWLVRSAKADAVFRKHHARQCDFRGKKLRIGDPIVKRCAGKCICFKTVSSQEEII